MYQVWSLYYGEFLALGFWGIVLTLARRILFGGLCREATLDNGEKGRMLKAMTLKFEKSYEVKVGIHDIPVFVKKYLCQERRFGIRLCRWRQLPERWTGIVLGAGFVEAVILRFLGFGGTFCLNRFLAGAAAAAVVRVSSLWFESESLWEQAEICLLDYVANTLYPRQMHVYDSFAEETAEPQESAETPEEHPGQKRGIVLEKEEEKLFQEVLSDFLGSST